MNPTRRKTRALNMDNVTGQNTPANVPKVLVEDDGYTPPFSTFPDEVEEPLLPNSV
jgi:hypothetical protein